jgi:YesN/AraC family two-component response regulator
MRILIVDDSAMMRAMIKRVIKMADVQVESILEASNGAEGLELLRKHDVQLLLTDINMP